jgi:hypothetical protein
MASQPDFKSEPPATKKTEEASKPQAPLRRVSSEETERPPSAQQIQRDDSISSENDEEPDDQDIDSDPAAPVVGFDWDELHRKYHDAMDTCHVEEAQLTDDWESLMNVHMRCSVSRLRC